MSSERERDGQAAPAAPAVTEEPARRPGTVVAAAAVSAAEALALAVWGLYVMIAPLFSHPGDLLRAEVGGLVLVLTGLLPGFAAWGLWKRRRWGRGPAATLDLCCLPVGWTIFGLGGSLAWPGILVMAVSIVGLVCLVAPSTGRALGVYGR